MILISSNQTLFDTSEVDEGNQADMEANDEAKVTVQDKEEADVELSKQRKKGEGEIWLTLVDLGSHLRIA